MKFSEKWGDSVENAVELALQDLKLTIDDVNVTVLEEPSKGFFGIGSKLAKVRVEEKPKAKPAKVQKTEAPKAEAEPKANKKAKKEKPAKIEKPEEEIDFDFGQANIFGERPTDLVEVEEHVAKTFLKDIFEKMGLDVNVKVSVNAECVYADVDGPDSGTVIGKRGQSLDSIQYLTSLVVNKGESGYTRVVIDAEGYRQKREIALEKLAVRLAEKAKRSGRSVRLEPMNPYERKVIHTALQKVSGVTTRSEGEEPFRRVIIEPKK